MYDYWWAVYSSPDPYWKVWALENLEGKLQDIRKDIEIEIVKGTEETKAIKSIHSVVKKKREKQKKSKYNGIVEIYKVMEEVKNIPDYIGNSYTFDNKPHKMILDWGQFLDRELGESWTFDLAPLNLCYKTEDVKINNTVVSIYSVAAIQPVESVDHFVIDFNIAVVNRYVYEFECKDNPRYLSKEKQLDFRRRENKLSIGRFKTKKEALEHARQHIANIEKKYIISKDNADKFPIPIDDFDKCKKVLDAYIPWKESSQRMYGMMIDNVLMFNTYEDKLEKWYRINAPFIRLDIAETRSLFGVKEILADGDKDGLSLYIREKEVKSFDTFMWKLSKEFVDRFMFEIVTTERKFGDQNIPDDLYEDDEEYSFK